MSENIWKLGTTSDLYMGSNISEEEAVKLLAKTGFEALDFGMFNHQDKNGKFWGDDYKDYAKVIAETAKESGIVFSQVHAPMFSQLSKDGDKMFELTRRSFEIAEILDAPYLVIHPQFWPDCILGRKHEETLAYNLKFYRSLLDISTKTGVKIALENMFGYDPEAKKLCITYFSLMEDILEFLDRTEAREQFVVCLDIGHANIIGKESPADCIRKLNQDLKLLHIHDNYGVNDDHMPPFNGNVDWEETMRALHEINYNGTLSLEAQSLCQRVPASDMPLRQAAVDLTFQTIRHLSEL